MSIPSYLQPNLIALCNTKKSTSFKKSLKTLSYALRIRPKLRSYNKFSLTCLPLKSMFFKPTWTLIGLYALPKLQFNSINKQKLKFTSTKKKYLSKSFPTLLYLKSSLWTNSKSIGSSFRVTEKASTSDTWAKPYLFIGKPKSSNKFSGSVDNVLLTRSKLFLKTNKKLATLVDVKTQKNKFFLQNYLNTHNTSMLTFKQETSTSKRKFFKKYLKHRLLQKNVHQLLNWVNKRPNMNQACTYQGLVTILHKLRSYSTLPLFKLRRKKEFLALFFSFIPYYRSETKKLNAILGIKLLKPKTTVVKFIKLSIKPKIRYKKTSKKQKTKKKINFTYLVKKTRLNYLKSSVNLSWHFRSIILQVLTTSTIFKKLSFQLFTQDETPKVNSFYGLNFILPIYGFLFITSYSNIAPNQSRLLVIQKYSFLYLNDFKKLLFGKFNKVNTFNKFFFHQHNWQTQLQAPLLNQTTKSSDLLHYFNSAYKQTLKLTETRNALTKESLSLTRIKFKPGYSRLWRTARTTLKFLLNLKFTYQKKLTRYLVKFFRLNKLTLLKHNELKLSSVLTSTSMVPDRENALSLISNNLVFINGQVTSNPTFLIFKNDFIQLLISLKYYVLFKWLKNFQLVKRKRLNKFISNISLNKLNKDKKKSRVILPNWTLNALLFNYDVPQYLEIDYLTLSVFCLYEPFLPQDFNQSLWNLEKVSIYNLYNWKYIT